MADGEALFRITTSFVPIDGYGRSLAAFKRSTPLADLVLKLSWPPQDLSVDLARSTGRPDVNNVLHTLFA
ncbi:hypothetical protein X777_00479 [Ooceraea biroi]|uniref:Uncharacterized protein n=1 Tax=Ooceraea biroi TaxID=2015173 RepID=A0A026WTQ8_OOCBI|nr:hypothetical protein X777_00479 [Ooceraea biroi]